MIVMTPPMGWNTWNTFGEKISEDMIKESADAMVKNGLLDAGYNYLVIDDCWAKRQRNPETQSMEADPEKFPNGMKAVADYVHSKGLKFGMYSCAGVRTCAGYPGSYGHEFLDAETFADFDIDFLKYDYCFRPHKGLPGEMLYHRMGNALRATFSQPATGVRTTFSRGSARPAPICIVLHMISWTISSRSRIFQQARLIKCAIIHPAALMIWIC